MKEYSIEQLDKMRNRLLLFWVIGWSCWFGCTNVQKYMDVGVMWGILLLLGIAGWILWTIYLVKMNKFNRFLKMNPRINRALHDELYKTNQQKAWAKSFFVIGGTVLLLYVLSHWIQIPAKMICEILFFQAVVVPPVCMLFYNRIADSDGVPDA